MPYKFNGKEMDAETGLYYYGARYIGYVYTLDNLVKLVDTDGRIVNYPKNQRTKRTKVYYKKVVVSSPHGFIHSSSNYGLCDI